MKTSKANELKIALQLALKCKGTSKNASNFFFNAAKNIRIIEKATQELTDLVEADKLLKQTDDATEYYTKLQALYVKHCKKKENGEPDLTEEPNGGFSYFFPLEVRKKLNDETQALKIEYSDYLSQQELSTNAINECLNTEVELQLVKLKQRELPSDISGEVVNILFDYIEEEE